MRPDQRREVGDVDVVDIHAMQQDVANDFAFQWTTACEALGAKPLVLSVLQPTLISPRPP